ncbi:Hypothetical protein FKW44_002888, partial [Caligus rogercresseyi]
QNTIETRNRNVDVKKNNFDVKKNNVNMKKKNVDVKKLQKSEDAKSSQSQIGSNLASS